jgi:TolB protein
VQRISHTDSNDQAAFWSPDNRRISFTSDRDGNSEIYVMDSDGRNARRLTRTRATERAAVWSPKGNKILFHSEGDDLSSVYVMNSDGSGVVSFNF